MYLYLYMLNNDSIQEIISAIISTITSIESLLTFITNYYSYTVYPSVAYNKNNIKYFYTNLTFYKN